jgi:hypothetical protein
MSLIKDSTIPADTPSSEKCDVGTVTFPTIRPVFISIATDFVKVPPTSTPILILLITKTA